MNVRYLKIVLILASFIFTTGFLPFAAMLGPGITIASSGNVYKAGAQFVIDSHIKKKTGKNSFAYVKQEVSKQNKKNVLDSDLKELVETRIKIVHKKLAQQSEENYLNKDLRYLVEKRIKVVRKKLDIKKVN